MGRSELQDPALTTRPIQEPEVVAGEWHSHRIKTLLRDYGLFQLITGSSKALDSFCFLSRVVGTCCFIFIL